MEVREHLAALEVRGASAYVLHAEKGRRIFYTDILSYASNMNLVKGIIEGQVKQIIMKQVSVKAEDSTLVMTNGKLNVHAKGKWDVGKLNLFPLTTQVATSVKALELPWVNIGKHAELHIYIKGSNTTLKDSARPHLKNKTELVSRYWVVAAQQTPDARKIGRASCRERV